MQRGLTGTYTSTIAGGVACQAFVPLPLRMRWNAAASFFLTKRELERHGVYVLLWQ